MVLKRIAAGNMGENSTASSVQRAASGYTTSVKIKAGQWQGNRSRKSASTRGGYIRSLGRGFRGLQRLQRTLRVAEAEAGTTHLTLSTRSLAVSENGPMRIATCLVI